MRDGETGKAVSQVWLCGSFLENSKYTATLDHNLHESDDDPMTKPARSDTRLSISSFLSS